MSTHSPDGARQDEPRTEHVGPVAKVWSLRTVVAVAITSVALSGLGGAALAAASDGGSANGGGPGRGGFGGGPGTNGPPNRHLHGQMTGQLPGGQAPSTSPRGGRSA